MSSFSKKFFPQFPVSPYFVEPVICTGLNPAICKKNNFLLAVPEPFVFHRSKYISLIIGYIL
jgi:hypothetical protein